MVADADYRLFDPAVIARFRARVADSRFALATARLKDRAQAAVKATRLPIAKGGGWTHDYQCPTHATKLTFDESKPHEHACSVDGEVHRGPKLDEAWVALFSRAVVNDLRDCAFAHAAFGDDRHLQRARSILNKWAELYPGYVPHGTHAGKGLCMGQSLDEAVWVIDFGQAYDLVRDRLPADEREAIETHVLRRCGDHLLTQLFNNVHNIECWHLAGLAIVARLLRDDRYFAPALRGEFGMSRQLKEGFLDDGWWWEGSPHYHYYALDAVQALVSAAGVDQLEPDALARLRLAYDVALDMARADASIPSLNDGWIDCARPGWMDRNADFYEWASHSLGGTHYDEVLANAYASGSRKRQSLAAMLYGRDELPASRPPRRKSVLQQASGYGILRHSAPAGEVWAMLKFGPHGGGHGHPDKAALLLHAFGQPLSDDLGTPGYGIAMNKSWYRTTLAHNAPLIDGVNQPPAAGRLIAFQPTEGREFGVVDVETAWTDEGPYAGVTIRRALILRPIDAPYLIDVVRITAPGKRTVDLPLHHLGQVDATLAPAKPITDDIGFEHLADWRLAPGALTIRTADAGSTIALASSGGEAFVATSPANPASGRRTTVLRRVTGREAMFVTVISPFARQPANRNVRWIRTTSTITQLAIEGDDLHEVWAIGVDDASLALPDDTAHGGTARIYRF